MMAETAPQSSILPPASNLYANATTQIHTVSDAPSAPKYTSARSDCHEPAAVSDQPAALTSQLDALVGMPAATLRQHWSRLYKTQPPLRMSRDLLLLAISWKLQARSLGGLGASDKRKLAEMARKLDSQDNVATLNSIRLKPGTKLIREWHGDIHEILVLETGFEWRGNPYRSLTQIAFQITGAHWSGPRFFGLKSKPDNFAKTSVVNSDGVETEARD